MTSPASSVVVRRSPAVGSRYRSPTGSSRWLVRSVAPSASSAAATSDGCADAQKSFAKIACSRCSPSAAWQRSPPWRRHGYFNRQYQQRVACSRFPPIEPMFRSCGEAARRHASRSASGIWGSTSSSASVVPAPIRPPSIPRGTTPRTSTSFSAWRIPSRSSGTTSVPPWMKTAPSRASTLSALTSSNLLLRTLARPLLCLPQRAQHLLAADRQLVDVRSGRVADRVRDRGGGRDDRRLAEPLGAEVRQVTVGPVDELADDLRHVGDRRHAVRVERRRQHPARLRVEQPLLGERVADALDDPALDLTARAERVDDPPDVVRRRDALDTHLARLDVHGHLDHLDAEGEDAHAGRVRAPAALAEDLRVLEQPHELLERLREIAVGRHHEPVADVEHALLEVVALRRDLDQLPLGVRRGGAYRRPHRGSRRRAGR